MNDQLTSGENSEISAQEPIIHLTENGVVGFEVLCRLCANRSDHLISIYSEEGISNDLADKMNLYLPVKVAKTDLLPLQCCFQCASTVLTWHELVIASIEADKRLRDVQAEVEKQLAENNAEIETESEAGPSQPVESEKIFIQEDRCASPEIVFIMEPKLEKDISEPLNTLNNESQKHLNCKSNHLNCDIEQINCNIEPINCNIQQINCNTEQLKCKTEELSTSDSDDDEKSFDQPLPKTFQCSECKKYFFRKVTLERHIRIHNDERPFICDQCGLGFRTKSGLSRHIKHVHYQKKNFQCEICSQNFATNATRNDHQRIHTKQRPFICQTCGKRFASKAGLYIHSKIHSDVFPFSCGVCEKKFRRRQELLAHSSTHSGERPFKCMECGKSFRIKTLLTSHMLIHSDFKPFFCDICGIAYRQVRYLKKHMVKKHSDFENNAELSLIIPDDDISLNPFRQEKIEQLYKSDPDEIPATKKRGRTPKSKVSHAPNDVKIEGAHGEFQTTDGSWIKTELVLESDEVNPFIDENCDMEEQELKLTNSDDDNSDFDDLDPDYNPGTNSASTKLHVCSSCGKLFRNLSDYNKHLQICANTEENEMMKIETLDDSSEEYNIIETKSKSDSKFKREYRCDYCVWVAVRKDDLRKHIQDAHPQHYATFNEKRQRKRSKIDQDAVNAAKVVVDSRTYYHCNQCGKNLHSPYTYIWHNRIHTGERPFVCDLCGKQFRVSQGLVRHLRETHAGIKNFPCDLCGRMFATRRNVEEHRRIHTNERPYICDLCGKAFKQKASLFVHNRSHTDSFPFKCSYCNQGFRTRPPLLVHVTRHTGEKPYACDICGRCFRIKYELKRHRLIHSDDKPFSCTDCGISFRQKRYLRNHNKTNHNRVTP